MNAIIFKRHRHLIFFFFVVLLRYRENCRTTTCTNSTAGYPYLVAMFKCNVGVRIVRVSFNFDDAVVKDWLGNIPDISHFVR